VTSFDEAKLEESFQFQQRLKREGYVLAAFIVNRAFPLWLQDKAFTVEETAPEEKRLVDLCRKMYDHYRSREDKMREFRRKIGGSIECFRVPEFQSDIYNLSGIEMVAQNLRAEQ
jgi:hypothetical protein